MRARRAVVRLLERLDTVLDHVPSVEGWRLYRFGGWGCRFGLADRSARLDDRWQTGVWRDL